jgi:beta-lactamase class D
MVIIVADHPGAIMKSSLFIMISLHILFSSAQADDLCFMTKENDKITSTGECTKRHPPQSTFKLAISLMGFNEGILIDETHPVIPFSKGYADDLESWKEPQDPTSWIKNSCVWYSQYITKKLGMNKFQSYIKKFDYGNQDVSGVKRKPDGLTSSWITSSLKISPKEQVLFLEKFLNSKLPVDEKSIRSTHNIFYLEELTNNWKLYGKTGAGDLTNSNGSQDKTHERGWFIGWIEKGNERVIFAQYVEEKNIKTKENNFGYVASKHAKALAKEKLLKMIADKK